MKIFFEKAILFLGGEAAAIEETEVKSGTRRSWFEFRRKIGVGGRLGLGLAAWLVFVGIDLAPLMAVVCDIE